MAGRSARRNSAEPSTIRSPIRQQPPKRKTSHGESSNVQGYRHESKYQTCIGLDTTVVKLLKEKLEKSKEKEQGKEITLTRTANHPESIAEADEASSAQNGSYDANGVGQCVNSSETGCLSNGNRTESKDHEEEIAGQKATCSDGSGDRVDEVRDEESGDSTDINGNTTTGDLCEKNIENGQVMPGTEDTKSNVQDSGSETIQQSQDIVLTVAQNGEGAKVHDGMPPTSDQLEKNHVNKAVPPCSVTVNLDRFFTTSSDKDQELVDSCDDQIVFPSIKIEPSIPEEPPSGVERGIENLFKATLLPGVASGEPVKNTVEDQLQKTITVKLDQCSSLNVHVKQVSSHVRRASTGSPAIEFAVPINNKSC